jgi:hypothetical protein
MDQIKQTKAGSALEMLICLHVYEHQLEGGDKEKERAKFRAEIPADRRTSRAVLYSPILRAMFKAINAVIEGDWTPGDDAAPEIKAMAAILKAQGIAGLLAEEPTVSPFAGAGGVPTVALPTLVGHNAPIPLEAVPRGPTPLPAGPFTAALSSTGSDGPAAPVPLPLPTLGTPFALPPLPGLGG